MTWWLLKRIKWTMTSNLATPKCIKVSVLFEWHARRHGILHRKCQECKTSISDFFWVEKTEPPKKSTSKQFKTYSNAFGSWGQGTICRSTASIERSGFVPLTWKLVVDTFRPGAIEGRWPQNPTDCEERKTAPSRIIPKDTQGAKPVKSLKNVYFVYCPFAVSVGTRRAPEKAREKVKKTRFHFQEDRGDLTHKSSRLTQWQTQ